MGGGEGEWFRVTVSKKEVVAAVLPMQEHWLPLSNLDLLLPPVDVGVFFCYTKPHYLTTFASMLSLLKKTLAQALVSFYAFSGEVVSNSVGEPELLCNNRGVDFIQAFADVDLQNLNLYNPDHTIEGKLVPKKKHGVLAVQATELKCGGIVVGCTFDHRISDAYSANMFLESWAEMAQSKPISIVPSFRRSLLNPRRPPSIHPSIYDMYTLISSLPPPKEQPGADQLISRIYYIKGDQLTHIQALANEYGNNSKRTKLEAFSALMWKMVAACAVNGDINAGKKITKMGIVVDGRSRLSEGEERDNAMGAYFGNVLSIPFGEKRVEEMAEKPVSWVAEQVHEFLQVAVTKEHFLGLVDYVETQRPHPALAKIYGSGSEDGPAFVVSSGQRFPVSKVDFGWGKPVFGSYHFPWGGDAGYVMPMPSPTGNGDWVVYMHLFKKMLEWIETEAANLFKPLTFDYLNSLISHSDSD